MLSLKKLLRDLWQTRSRATVMVFSISLGLLAFNTLVGAYSVLTREVVRNYMDSDPASIILELDHVSDEALRFVQSQGDVKAAIRRTQLMGRFSTSKNGEKRRAFLFVVDDFQSMQVAKLLPQSGAYPPLPGTVLIERSAIPIVGGGVGATLFLEVQGRSPLSLPISGIVHEPALAPAGTEQAVYAYISHSELAKLGLDVSYKELRFNPQGESHDIEVLENQARDMAKRLERGGLGHIEAIRVPPPAHHPHQSQMTTVLSLFLVFSWLVLVLSGLLTGSLISTMMARQVREMAVMKTLGATNIQITFAYVLLVEAIATVAYAVSYYPSIWGTDGFVHAITQLLNFDVENPNPTVKAQLVQLGAALTIPLLVTFPALQRGSRVSVTEALTDYGVGTREFGSNWSERWISRLEIESEYLSYTLRNALRRRGRFMLSLSLLSTAGAIFFAAINMAGSWETVTAQLYASRHYDFEVGLHGAFDTESVRGEILDLEEVEQLEVWSSTRTALGTGHRVPIERTYPDGAHGAFWLMAPPDGSSMVTMNVSAGRLFNESSDGEVILNQVVPDAAKYAVGDRMTLSVDGKDHLLTIVGKIEEVGTGAVAYVSERTFRSLVEPGHQNTLLRIRKNPSFDVRPAMDRTDGILSRSHAPVTHLSPLSVFENAVAAHFEIMVKSLLALSALTAVVGAMGLGSALSANVFEGTRELGVLRALGATGAQVRTLVVWDGLLVCVLSWVLAAAMGLVLSLVIGNLIGMMSFQLPLPLTPQYAYLTALLFVFIVLGALASILPAQRAANLTVGRALRAL